MEDIGKFVADQRGRIASICQAIDEKEKHFGYVSGEIQLLEKYLPDGEKKQVLVKKVVSDVLQHFNALNEYRSDVRMLFFWKLLGKYSVELKMEGVLTRLNGLGFFRATPEFYALWAEHWAAQKDRARVNEIIATCLNNCRVENALEIFRPVVEPHFGSVAEIPALKKLPPAKLAAAVVKDSGMSGETLKRRISNLQPLSRVLEVSEEKSSSVGNNTTSHTGNNNSNAPAENNAHQQQQNVANAAEMNKVPATSFTMHMYKDAINVFAQTLPFDEDGCMQSQPTTPAVTPSAASAGGGGALKAAFLKEGFSVYCDETTACNPQTQSSAPSSQREFVDGKKEGEGVPPPPTKEGGGDEFSIYCDEMTAAKPATTKTVSPRKESAGVNEAAAANTVAATTEGRGDYRTKDSSLSAKPDGEKRPQSKIPTPIKALEKDSPYAKRMRRQDFSFNEESLLGNSISPSSPKRPFAVNFASKRDASFNNAQNRKKNTDEVLFGGGADDDMTVAGAHGKFAASLATSTPRRSVAPGLNLFSPAENEFGFNDAEAENHSIFGVTQPLNAIDENRVLSTLNNYGSSLQRRLSVAPRENVSQPNVQKNDSKNHKPKQTWKASELVEALPRLCIKTPVPEDSREALLTDENGLEEDKENRAVETSSLAVAKNVSLLEQQKHQKQILVDENVVQDKCLSPDVCTNPWDEKERRKILKLTQIMVQCHDFSDQVCPKVDVGKKVELGGESFNVQKLLGEGGFAKVFRAVSEENKSYAIKYELPACPWEVYICDSLQRRLPKDFLPFVMDVRDAFIFSNASAIIYDFYPCGTLLDLSNHYKKEGLEMGGLMVTFFGIQLGRILEQVHAAKIIHADIKPDNVVIAAPILGEDRSIKDLIGMPAIKIIDWGRSIDVYYNPEREFVGRAGTKCFDCIEMISNQPWNYQTDFFGFVATIHVLMFNEYLVTTREHEKIRPVKQIKRRLALRAMWLDIFEKFLNIPDCKTLPSWEKINNFMEEQLKQEVKGQQQEWKKAIERFNACIRAISTA